jgi:hypothetical protein
MIKTIRIIALTLVLLVLSTIVALGSPDTIQAETGLILPPTGLEFNCSSIIKSSDSTSGLDPIIKASVSYGAFSTITITGEIEKSLTGSFSKKLAKVYFSPVHAGNGYTVYLDYDLDRTEISVYGVSLWSNSKHLLTFINLQNQTGVPSEAMPVTITPGVNLRLGKLRIGGEAVLKPSNLSLQVLRAGITYSLLPGIYAKLSVNTGLSRDLGQVYQLGLTSELLF